MTVPKTQHIWVGGQHNTVYRKIGAHAWQDYSVESFNVFDVSGSGPDDIWFAGNLGSDGVMSHWDGTTLEEVAVPLGTPILWCVLAISSTEAWAGGSDGTILRWDGTSWETVAHALTVTNTVYRLWPYGGEIVGVAARTGHTDFIAWDGTTWREEVVSTAYRAVDGWGAEGERHYMSGTSSSILYGYEGAWNRRSQFGSATWQSARSIGGTSNWIGGDGAVVRGSLVTWASRHTGSGMQNYRAIFDFGVNDVWFAGQDNSTPKKGAVSRYVNNTTWEPQGTLEVTGEDQLLLGLWGVEGPALAPDATLSTVTISQKTMKDFYNVDIELKASDDVHTNLELTDIVVAFDEDVAVAEELRWVSNGNYRVVVRNLTPATFDATCTVTGMGVQLTSQPMRTMEPDRRRGQHLWGCGLGGKIIYRQGVGMPVLESTPTTETLHAIKGTAPDDMVAVGNNGVVLHKSEAEGAWNTLASLAPENLFAVAVHEDHGIWVAGEDGLHVWDPVLEVWDSADPLGGFQIADIVIFDDGTAAVVGVNGLAATYDGSSWAPLATTWGVDNHCVYGTALNNLFVGTNGLSRWNGAAWSAVASSAGQIRQISQWGEYAAWAVNEARQLSVTQTVGAGASFTSFLQFAAPGTARAFWLFDSPFVVHAAGITDWESKIGQWALTDDHLEVVDVPIEDLGVYGLWGYEESLGGTAPITITLTSTTSTSVRVTFSQAIADNPSLYLQDNYTFSPSLDVGAITRISDTIIDIETSEQSQDQVYSLTVYRIGPI